MSRRGRSKSPHNKKVVNGLSEEHSAEEKQDVSSSVPGVVSAAVAPESPRRKLVIRMSVGLVMIGVFLSILYSHHWVVVAFCILLQVLSFRELVAVRFKEVKEQQLPFFRTLSWFAFAICEVRVHVFSSPCSYSLSSLLPMGLTFWMHSGLTMSNRIMAR
jgi:hypothetical protein